MKRPNEQEDEDIDNSNLKKGRTTRNNPMSCGACTEPTGPADLIYCFNCENSYHLKCAGITSQFMLDQLKKTKWMCIKCNYATLNLVVDVKSSCAKITKNVTELTSLTNSYEQLVKGLVARIDKVEDDVKQLLERPPCNCDTDELKSTIDQMRTEIAEIKSFSPNAMMIKQEDQINYLRSQQRRNNLIINGVPEMLNEDDQMLMNLVMRIGTSCGTVVKQDSIREIYRFKRKAPPTTTTSTTTTQQNQKPPAIFVRFSDHSSTKDELFFKYLELITKKTPLSCKSIGVNANNRIYLNHHLSSALLQAKDKAVALKKQGIIKTVTSRYNLVKININNTWHKINDLNQLKQTILKEANLDIDTILSHRHPGVTMET